LKYLKKLQKQGQIITSLLGDTIELPDKNLL
jgi:hypothetical protein